MLAIDDECTHVALLRLVGFHWGWAGGKVFQA